MTEGAPEQDHGKKDHGEKDHGPDGEAFWTWSLAVYARTGVGEALITLQDQAGLNVNILLWLAWRNDVGAPTGEALIRRAMAACEPIEAGIIAPLRQARRYAGAHFRDDALYTELKHAELAGERLQQSRLAAISPFEAGDTSKPGELSAVYGATRRDWALYGRLARAGQRAGFSTALLEAGLAAIYPGEIAI